MKKRQRVILFEDEKQITELDQVKQNFAELELIELERRIHRNAEYLPLTVFCKRNNVKLPVDATIENETAKLISICFKQRRKVKKINSRFLGLICVFPVDILNSVYFPTSEELQ